MSEQHSSSLAEAVTVFISTLTPEQKQVSQQELNKFVRWFGGERPVRDLNAKEIGDFSNSISAYVTDSEKKLEPVRSFLSFAKKKKLIDVSLAPHLRVSKAKQGKPVKAGARGVIPVDLTPDGYASLEAELDMLKAERPRIAEQLRHAAADKDFRENAPLEAARERQGQIEARIREIDAILKGSTIIEEKPKASQTIGIGCVVKLRDLGTGEQLCYTLVSPSEANPLQGKLSIASPTGKALLDQEIGAVVEVVAPVGTLKYQIDDIKF
ncbi:MAG TPA: transcription elongation factor GreA [Dehalococcoidia bacterium]|nr:transcription elongation factor GreA [Dehalococcoidia bacterium]